MRGAVAALGLVLAGWPAAGIAQTAITPDVAAGRALGTTVSQAGTVFSIDGGTRAGTNLFHSFSRFDLGAGDTAAWVRAAGDAGQIRNVVSRVTGGEPSVILGALDSTALPNAGFWFVNPAGIVFGPGAQVNVPSAAHFSTASDLRFADGARFAIATPDGSTLSVAAPEAWGFVGGQGDIAITGVADTFAPTTRLSFAAANVGIADSTLVARGLDLVAVGDQATGVRFDDPLSAARGGGGVTLTRNRMAIVNADSPGAPARISAGEIVVASTSLASVTTGAGRGGDVLFRADRVAVAPDGIILTSASAGGAGGDVRVNAQTIDVDARGATTTTGFASAASASGAAGAIALDAETIRLTGEVGNTTGSGFAFIGSTVLGTGGSGDVDLSATDLVIDVGLISSTSVGDGDGGTIRLSGRNLELGGANVITSSFGAGAAGNVIIDGDTIAISGGSFGATPGTRQQSGELAITASTSIEADGGFLSAISASPTSSGQITLRAPLIFLSQTNINSAAFDAGLAGQVTLEADQLLLDRVFVISDSDDGAAATGLVRLKSTGDVILFQGFYSTNVNGLADGGRIEVEGRNVLVDGAFIQTVTEGFGTGDAGQVAITAAQDLSITGAAFINSSSDSEGRAGSIALTGRNVTIDEQSLVLSNSEFSGDAGNIKITAVDRLDLDTSDILTQSRSGTGNGGSIGIQASRFFMADATVSSDTQTSGMAGTVSVRAGQIELDGRNRPFTGISSSTSGDGDAGSVTIDAQSLTIRNLAFVVSESFANNFGNAGEVTIRTGDLSLLRGGVISTSALRANGGDISITATRDVTLTSEPGFSSFILAVANSGDAGNIGLNVGGTLRLNGSTISSDTFGEGDAGRLTIKADTLALTTLGDLPASITSSTDSFGDAGAISIDARTITMGAVTQIRSVSAEDADGDARSVTINADSITLSRDAIITTATLGRGDAGEVAIATKTLRVDGGEVSSSAGLDSSGIAGNVTISAVDVDVVNGGALTTLSGNTNRAGVLRVTATGQLNVDGERSSISSANLADGRGDAGAVFLTAGGIRVANGGSISTDAIAGAAGDIDIRVPRPGLLVLEGGELPGLILTSSGPGTGGRITISDPLAIISNGGRILALGELRGANVLIQSRYFVNSTDRRNVLAVDGEVEIQTGLYDVSSGVVGRELSVLDASKVLRGQCPATRASGAVSQLITRPVGPYAREPVSDPLVMPAAPSPAAASGACP